MKKIFTTIVLAIMFAGLSLAENRVQIVIDYTQGIYQGMTYEQIIVDEEDFIKDRPRYEGEFFEGIQKTYSGTAYRPDAINPSEPLISIKIIKVSYAGNVKAEVTYGEKTATLKGRGGAVGTFLNLFGDGMKRLGKSVGNWLTEQQ